MSDRVALKECLHIKLPSRVGATAEADRLRRRPPPQRGSASAVRDSRAQSEEAIVGMKQADPEKGDDRTKCYIASIQRYRTHKE